MNQNITGSLSVWRAPRLSLRWVPVFQRNLLVWRKLLIPSLVGNIAEPLITLVAFGYGLGALVGQVQLQGMALPYIVFLASGSICMSAISRRVHSAMPSVSSRSSRNFLTPRCGSFFAHFLISSAFSMRTWCICFQDENCLSFPTTFIDSKAPALMSDSRARRLNFEGRH